MNKRDLNGIHETVLVDIAKVFFDMDLIDVLKKTFGRNSDPLNSTSIAKAASNLVLTFPVLVDESVTMDTVALVAKNVEGKALSMLQLIFSAISANALKNNDTALDIIGKVHKNLSSDDIEDYIQQMEIMASNESVEPLDNIIKAIREENIIIDSFEFKHNIPAPIDSSVTTFDEAVKRSEMKERIPGSKITSYNPEVKANELRKINGMSPSIMVIKFHTDANDVVSQVAIGVKAKLQFIPQDEVVYRISSKNRDKNFLFDFLRSTTREISFVKDFLFAIDQAKIDAIKIKNSSSSIWKILERRSIRNRSSILSSSGNGYGGICSLVISSDTLEILAKEYDFKANIPTIENLITQYNLLAFFVADDVKEKLTYLYDDGSRQFEISSYSSLEKEDKKEFKKIISLLVAKR